MNITGIVGTLTILRQPYNSTNRTLFELLADAQALFYGKSARLSKVWHGAIARGSTPYGEITLDIKYAKCSDAGLYRCEAGMQSVKGSLKAIEYRNLTVKGKYIFRAIN